MGTPLTMPAAATGNPDDRSFHFHVDFDGTIAIIDTVDTLLSLYAEPRWLEIEEAWVAGQIGSRDAMAAQVALLRLRPEELEAFADSVEIDPGFLSFAHACADHRIPLTVVSDGLDRVVARVLARHGLSYPIRANRLEQTGADRWRLTFPYAADGCGSGNCKCRTPSRVGALRVLIGDGRSDFCAADTVDLCLAKSKLIQHCRDEGIPHVTFTDFHDVTSIIGDLISGRLTPVARVQAKEAQHAR
jgi:2-hydroxy-3-keto-5-methylthiopentenyl-1-phosphate phosphatase